MHASGHFSLKSITKVEGHANLDIELYNGEVKKCELQIYEGQRFFEQMVLGRSYNDIPLIVSRICGLCNVSHLNTAIESVEKAFEVPLSEQAAMLRDLATNGEFIKSHALHLLFLVSPDYLHKESVLDFGEKEHHLIHWGMDLKKAGSDIVKLLGGRIYQTAGIRPGGFTLIPEEKQLNAVLKRLADTRKIAIEAIKLFASFEKQLPFEKKTDYLALSSPSYSFVKGELHSSNGTVIKEEDMLKHVHEFIVPYSNAKQADLQGKDFRVGALARVNLNQKALEGSAKDLIKSLGLKFPSDKIYYNNIAQAIEMLHCIDSSIRIISELNVKKEPIAKIKPKEAIGIGVTEAPRGTLYHEYSFDEKGFVKKATIVVPTNQNSRTIENDLKQFIPSLLSLPQEKANLEIEKLVRAYDPCISCATHFLKVKWKKTGGG